MNHSHELTDLEEVAEKLEEEQIRKEDEPYQGNWDQAHKQYSNGNPDMLEKMIQLQGQAHQIDTFRKLRRKGENLRYDKNDCFLTGLISTFSAFQFHPIFLTMVFAAAYKIFSDSLQNLDSKDENIWSKINSFGMELIYFLTGLFLTGYFFISVQDQGLILSKAGTVATVILEVTSFAASTI